MCPTMASISKPNSRSKSPHYLSSFSGESKPFGPLTGTGGVRLTCEVPYGGREGRENLLPVANHTEPC